jgi:hypothetical protein
MIFTRSRFSEYRIVCQKLILPPPPTPLNCPGRHDAVTLFQAFAAQLAEKVRKKSKAFFIPLLFGALLAIARRRTVTTWLQAAQISDDFRSVFYHMPGIGRKSPALFDKMTDIILQQLGSVIKTASYI